LEWVLRAIKLRVVAVVVLEVLGVVQVNLENNFFQEDLLEF
jgi:hypothetical protein